MKLLIDESLNFELLDACRNAGINFICVKDILRGEPDEVIVKYSTIHKMPILTEDKDFGELNICKGFETICSHTFAIFYKRNN